MKKTNKRSKPYTKERNYRVSDIYRDQSLSNTDPLGSYTGIPIDGMSVSQRVDGGKVYLKVEEPTQDADDL